MSSSLASGAKEHVAKADDRAAWVDGLFRDHVGDVYRMVASLLGSGARDADIQDLTQEVFLAAHKNAATFRGDSKPSTWLYGIASRLVLTFLRSWRRHARLIRAVEDEPTFPRRADALQSTEQRQALIEVWRCLMKVRPEKRMVYVLYEVEGFSGKEIAEILGINEATVRTRLFHARRDFLLAWQRAHGGEYGL